MSTVPRAITDALSRKLADEGKLVEAGFAGLVLTFPDLSRAEYDRLRVAYMGGAQHLWASVMGAVLDDGAEPTEGDMRRMAMINDELENWSKVLAARLLETKGTA